MIDVYKNVEYLRKKDASVLLKHYDELSKNGDTKSLFFLAYLYDVGGQNLTPNYKKAAYYYEKHFDKTGEIISLMSLAKIYLYKFEKPSVALKLYKKLENYNNAVVFLNMGKIYEIEYKNLDLAIAYYKKAYDLGNLVGGIFYTRLQFHPDTSNSLASVFSNLFKHQWLRLKVEFISFVNDDDERIKLY